MLKQRTILKSITRNINVNPENAKIMMKLKIYLCRNVGFNALILNVNDAANRNNPIFVSAGF